MKNIHSYVHREKKKRRSLPSRPIRRMSFFLRLIQKSKLIFFLLIIMICSSIMWFHEAYPSHVHSSLEKKRRSLLSRRTSSFFLSLQILKHTKHILTYPNTNTNHQQLQVRGTVTSKTRTIFSSSAPKIALDEGFPDFLPWYPPCPRRSR